MNERDSEWSQVSHSSSTPNFIPNTHTQMTSDHQNCVELSRGSSPIGSGSGRGLALVGKGGGGWEHTATVTHFVNTQLHSRGWWQHSSRQATTSGFPWRSHPGYYRSITRQDLYSSELSTFLLLPSQKSSHHRRQRWTLNHLPVLEVEASSQGVALMQKGRTTTFLPSCPSFKVLVIFTDFVGLGDCSTSPRVGGGGGGTGSDAR